MNLSIAIDGTVTLTEYNFTNKKAKGCLVIGQPFLSIMKKILLLFIGLCFGFTSIDRFLESA